MLTSGRIVRLTRMRSIRCYECGEERGVWWFTAQSLPSRRRRGKSMWVMRGFEFRLSLSLSLSLRLKVLVWGVVCLLLIFSTVGKFIFYIIFSLLVGSNWVFFVFYREGNRLAEKLLLIICIFWQISSTFGYALILCAETPFTILKKVSAPIISGECYRGR